MDYAPIILKGLGVIGETVGNMKQASDEARAYKDKAKFIAARTESQRSASDRDTARVIARNRNMAGAAGVDPFSGTAAAVEMDNAFQGGMNSAWIEYMGNFERSQALNAASSARSKMWGAFSKGAIGAGSVLNDWWTKSQEPKKDTRTRASSFDSWWGG